MPLQLSTPVKSVRHIGPRIAAGLAERGIHTIEDLLYHLPFRYEDRLHPKPLSLYNPGDMASLFGEVRGTALLRTRSGPIFEMTVGITPPVSDTTNLGAPGLASETWVSTDPTMAGLLNPRAPILETVKCMWFHGTYLKDKFKPGQKIALYGKLEGSRSGNALYAPPNSTRFKMIQPTFEILPDSNATGEDAEFILLEMGRIVPIYEYLGGKAPTGSKLTSRGVRRILWTIFKDLTEPEALSATPSQPPKNSGAPGPDSGTWVSTNLRPATRSLPPSAQDGETLPTSLRNRLAFPTRMAALRDLHFPPAGTSMTDLMSARTPAHRRLIFEEFFYLELGLELKRRKLRNRQGTAFITNDQVREALKQILPFKPTSAQKRVLGEIVHDMRRTQPMRRLLQGDVGSGKTIVAFQAALIAIENGYQVALMAPTEILATQHYLSARKLLSEKISPRTKRPYRIGLLTGSLDDKTKRDTRARIFRGEIDLAIGTHALVEENVDFANLGLVIVDEQHRFGVQQRFQLIRKPNTGSASTSLPIATDPGAPGLASETWVPTGPSGAPSIPTAPSSEWVGENQSDTTTQLSTPTNPGAPGLASETWVPTKPPGAPSIPTAPSSEWVGENQSDTTTQLSTPTNPGAPGLASETWVPTKPPGAPSIPTAPSSEWVGMNQSDTTTQLSTPTNPGAPGLASETWVPTGPPGAPSVAASSQRVGMNKADTTTQLSTPTNPGAPGLASETWVPTKPPGAPGLASETWVPTGPSGAPSVAASSQRVGMNKADTTTRSPSPSAQDSEPDVLVMTATPIPRTLALTLYGDLEASVIDELPPGRTPIQTRRMPEERSAEVWDFIRKQVAAGRQAYIVYPIIEGNNDDQPELDFATFDNEASASSERNASTSSRSDNSSASLESDTSSASLGLEGGFSPLSNPRAKKGVSPGPTAEAAPTARSHHSLGQRPRTSALKNPSRAESPTLPGLPKTPKSKRTTQTKLRSATDMHHDLQQGPLAGLRLGLLHGRMSPDDKEVTMARFKRGELDVLVSTTVIEVGVDVPNATVMVIEHADRFGLAQLHQLRGRVGRGAAKSFCILITAATVTPEADARLNAMVQTQDGFALAELDLQQRGPGEFFGTKQAGLPEFRVANLARDRDLLELARQEAAHFAEQEDPAMPRPEIDAVWTRLKQQWQRRYGLVEA